MTPPASPELLRRIERASNFLLIECGPSHIPQFHYDVMRAAQPHRYITDIFASYEDLDVDVFLFDDHDVVYGQQFRDTPPWP